MARRGWFGRSPSRSPEDVRAHLERIPSDLAIKCPSCGQILLQKELERDCKVCKKCQYHFRLTGQERLDLLLDSDSFEPLAFDLETGDPLHFPDYLPKVRKDQQLLRIPEAVIGGFGEIGGNPVSLSVTDFRFRAGSMNSVVGEFITRTIEAAIERSLPLILVSGSGGGARMQEGLLSLMQMPKTVAALARLDRAGLFSVCILTDPTMGGVLASWASLPDVLIAEPGAMIGFSGERVAAKVQTERPPENFRTAEFAFEHGLIDLVTPRGQLKETVARLVALDARRSRAAPQKSSEGLRKRSAEGARAAPGDATSPDRAETAEAGNSSTGGSGAEPGVVFSTQSQHANGAGGSRSGQEPLGGAENESSLANDTHAGARPGGDAQ